MMRCRYERTIYTNQSGFCIYSYRTEDTSVPEAARGKWGSAGGKITFTAVGYNLPATNTVEVDLVGNWTPSKYGLQLNVERFTQIMPQDPNGLVAFLSSGLIKGIGPETAKAIVATFGARTMEVLDHDPQQLLWVKGIAAGKLKKIIASYQETVGMRDLVAYLAPYGVSIKKAAKIMAEFGDNSLRIVQSDPFQLTKVKGFGFLTVDAIARQTKVSLRNPLRYSGAIQYILEEARSQGHLFLQGPELISKCHELLNRDCETEIVTENDIRTSILSVRKQKKIYVENTRVYLSYERMCEVKVAKRIVAMLLDGAFDPVPRVTQEIAAAEKRLGQTLSPSQRAAVEVCLTHPCSIVTGGPGTGKTTTLRVILDIYHRTFPDQEILLAAPTGRASRRMAEQTGMPASTLHSALGLITDDDSDLNDHTMLSSDLIVVDEVSMVDMRLAYALFERVKPGAQIIMVGDPDQLPSVGAGNVLREFLRCEQIPTAVLSSVFRQASNSGIYLNAQAINQNDTHLILGDDFAVYGADNGEQAAKLVLKTYLEQVQKYGIEGVQILSPFRKRGATGANALNEQIRELVNPSRRGTDEIKCGSHWFRVGDRIIQTCNRNGVSNGDVGVITGIDRGGDEPEIMIHLLDGQDLRYTIDMMEDIDLSYCLTIHKSQGSEYPCVIIPLLMENYVMLRRNLLYTAITRAKEKVILIGQKQAVFTAIHKNDVDKRNTVLADRIIAYYDREQKRIAC